MSLGRASRPRGKGASTCPSVPSGREAVPPFRHHSMRPPAPRDWWVSEQTAPKATAPNMSWALGVSEVTLHFQYFPAPGDTWALSVITGDCLGRDFPL